MVSGRPCCCKPETEVKMILLPSPKDDPEIVPPGLGELFYIQMVWADGFWALSWFLYWEQISSPDKAPLRPMGKGVSPSSTPIRAQGSWDWDSQRWGREASQEARG